MCYVLKRCADLHPSVLVQVLKTAFWVLRVVVIRLSTLASCPRQLDLARELWIRLEECEITFAEAASTFSEGPEAHRKGVMGPMEIGSSAAADTPRSAPWSASWRNMLTQMS